MKTITLTTFAYKKPVPINLDDFQCALAMDDCKSRVFFKSTNDSDDFISVLETVKEIDDKIRAA